MATKRDFVVKNGLVVTEGVTAASLDISGDVDVDGTLEADAITLNGTSLATSATTDTTNASNIGSGTLATGRLAAALTAQTSILNTSLVVGRDSTEQIKFSTNDQIIFRVGNADGVIFKSSGEIEATSLDISGDVDVDGTLEADAITVNGSALASSATTDTTNASNIGSGTLATGRLAAALTAQTSMLNTSLVVGRDADNQIKFSTDNQMIFRVGAGDGVTFKASGEIEATSLDISGDVDVDGTLEADAITLGGTAVAVSGGAFHDGFSDFVANEHIDHSGVSISAGNGLTGGGTIASTRTLTVGAGTGITVNTNDVAVTAAQTGITSVVNASLEIGRDADNRIKFGTDNQIIFEVSGGDNVIFKASGEIEASSLDISGDVDVDGTLETDNLTVGGQQGTDGQVLTSTGSGVAWEDAAGGGASTIGALTDVLMDATNFTNGFLLQTDSDGSAPTTGTLNGALDNIGLGKDVFAALTSGDYNIGIGNDALDALTTAVENVAIGYQAGSAIQGGGYNTVLGTYALLSVTSGLENVAIGRRALGNVSSGLQYNTAVGGMSGYGATGNYSTSIGNQAGRGSIGQQGVHVGALAGYNSSGTGGVNIGYRAGRYPTGNYNTFLGYEAGYGVSGNGAANNVAIGYEALHDVTSGSKNMIIGYEAGDNITSGSNNLVIGQFDVDVATGDDQIIIGSGDGGVTWIKGDSNGIKALKIKVKAVSGNTTLTDAQSGSYVYWTAGTLTLPATAESGQQYTIINNTGGSATPNLGTSNAIASGWTSHAAMSDETARTYVSVAANTWIYIG